MKRYLKLVVLLAFLIIALQYWALSMISEWLVFQDPDYLDTFRFNHPLFMQMATVIWAADYYLAGRYLMILFLVLLSWWLIKQKTQVPHA
jgi:hypothetical protein